MLTVCPECGKKTALLNNTCEHCGAKTKVCKECGNIVLDSCEVCDYCGLPFSKAEAIENLEVEQINIEENNNSAKKICSIVLPLNKKLTTIRRVLFWGPAIIALLMALLNTSAFDTYSKLTRFFTTYLIINIITTPISELLEWLTYLITKNKVLSLSNELNFNKQAYIDSIKFDENGNPLYDFGIAPQEGHKIILEALRTEKDSNGFKIFGTIFCTILSLFKEIFLYLGLLPAVVLLGLGTTDLSELAKVTIFPPNIFIILWIVLIIVTTIFSATLTIDDKEICEWIKENKTKASE